MASRPKPPIVERRYPRLAGASWSYHKVPEVTTLALGAQRLEDLHLEGLRLNMHAQAEGRRNSTRMVLRVERSL